MTIFWISNRNDCANFTEQPNMVEKPTTFGAAEACGPDRVEKPTTFGAAEACGPDMVEKPTTFGAAEACGPDMVEKPTTFGAAEACGRSVVEKPTTFGAAEACGPMYEENEYHVAQTVTNLEKSCKKCNNAAPYMRPVRETTLRMDQIYQSESPTLWGYFVRVLNSLVVQRRLDRRNVGRDGRAWAESENGGNGAQAYRSSGVCVCRTSAEAV
ncbi:hypothetical protein [Paenibacillus sp. FSL H3-0333]|uniref:hypothetical protein n=1 Tax=Paenibacillus sp. FSL H3-0333 TaxID=2921373 RepID=UPI0030F578EF